MSVVMHDGLEVLIDDRGNISFGCDHWKIDKRDAICTECKIQIGKTILLLVQP